MPQALSRGCSGTRQLFRKKKALWILTKALPLLADASRSHRCPKEKDWVGWCAASSEPGGRVSLRMLIAEAQKSDFVTTVVSVASQIFKPSHVNKNRFLPYDQLGLKQKADVLCKHFLS